MDTFATVLLFLGKVTIALSVVPITMLLREIIRDEREIARRRRERRLRRAQAVAPRPRHRVARRGWGALSQDQRAA